MPEISARQIGTTALRLLGVAAHEQPLTADMAESALDALNAMLDSWVLEKLLTYTRPKIPLVLVPGQGIYTWGISTPASDIPREPPVRLDMALLTVEDTTPGLEWEVEIFTQSEYQSTLWMKGMESAYPSLVYLEPTQPVARLHVWPVPQTAYTLQLLPWTAHAPYESWDHALSWPNGYQRAMQFNLALELAPQYGVEPSPLILRTAEDSKRAIFPINVEVGRLSLTPGRPRGGTPFGYPRGFYTGTR
jgi:hypothetical protein